MLLYGNIVHIKPFFFWLRKTEIYVKGHLSALLKEWAIVSRVLHLFLTFFVMQKANAQFNETIFYDTVNKISSEGIITGGYSQGKYLYLTGGSFPNAYSIPSLTKVDTAGNVIWTATDPELFSSFKQGIDISVVSGKTNQCLLSGQRIFTASTTNELWCVDDSSGNLLWKTKIPSDYVIKLVDLSAAEFILLTGHYGMEYHVINKETGKITYSRRLIPAANNNVYRADLMVDVHQNIIISWGDTCYKYRDRELNQLLWKSSLPYYGNKSIERIILDSNQYILAGMNNVSAVDTLTGNVIWYKKVLVGNIPLVQSGDDGVPRKLIIRDSLIYISWNSAGVGGVDLRRGFAMTCVNKYNGNIRYNVAYDFIGVPPDPEQGIGQDELDWIMDFCLDDNDNLYLTGSYDISTGSLVPGNWGIMKLNGRTGEKIYETTITKTPQERNVGSQGLVVAYKYGKLYVAGNLARTGNSVSDSQPTVVSFDSTSIYKELFRTHIPYTIRYPSSLVGMDTVGRSKMVLLKMVGRSGVVEIRTQYNELVWSKKISSERKFIIPHMVRCLHDTAIVASFLLMKEESILHTYPQGVDSLLFICLDTAGNIKYTNRLRQVQTDSSAPEPVQIYTDDLNRTNFIYKRWVYNEYMNTYMGYYYGFTPGSAQSSWGSLSGTRLSVEEMGSVLRKNIVSHYNVDTMVMYYASPGYRSSTLFCSALPDIASTMYTGFYLKGVNGFKSIFSSIPVGPTSQVIFGTDSSDHMFAARYDFKRPNPFVWKHAQTSGTILTGDTSTTHLYMLGRSTDNKLVISKIDRASGILSWSVEKSLLSRTAIAPIDYTFDQINKHFVIGGYLIDSALAEPARSYFYISLDSNGNILKELNRKGEIVGLDQINSVRTLQSGSHFYGGMTGTAKWGSVGFYNVDCTGNIFVPAVEIKAAMSTICPGSEVVFVANPSVGGTQPQYKWMLNGQLEDEHSDHFARHSPLSGDQVIVQMISNAACLRSNSASDTINIAVNDALDPSISLSGETHFKPGAPLLMSTAIANITGQPAYQWQDSTRLHSWQNIVQATGHQLLYAPRFNGDKIRCILFAENDCIKNFTTTSETLTFIEQVVLNPDSSAAKLVRVYPNPVHTLLVIDSLSAEDQWQSVEILSSTGKAALVVLLLSGQKKIKVNVAQLPTGVYIATLRGRSRLGQSYRFIKL